jgi:hypothetical protein
MQLKPRRSADSRTLWTSRDLPIPASPSTKTTDPEPPAAESTSWSSTARSAVRPIRAREEAATAMAKAYAQHSARHLVRALA